MAWYVFGLLVVAAIAESATTYVPSAQAMGDRMLTITTWFAILAGTVAGGLSVFQRRRPQSQMFQSKSALAVAVGISVLLTVVVLFGLIG